MKLQRHFQLLYEKLNKRKGERITVVDIGTFHWRQYCLVLLSRINEGFNIGGGYITRMLVRYAVLRFLCKKIVKIRIVCFLRNEVAIF